MQEILAQIAVSGEQQQAGGIHIKPTNRKQARVFVYGNELRHARPSLGIAHGGEIARGLVEHEVGLTARQRYGNAVDLDKIDQGINLGSQLACDATVHLDAPRRHEILRPPAARDASTG